MDKYLLIDEIREISLSIDKLAAEKSLATLDHKLKGRQKKLELLFDLFASELSIDDLDFLKSISNTATQLLTRMKSEKSDKAVEIIKHKNKGNRIRLFTTIAKQK